MKIRNLMKFSADKGVKKDISNTCWGSTHFLEGK